MPTNSPRLHRNNRIPSDAVAEAGAHNSSPTGAGLAHRHPLRLQPRSSVISSQLPAQGANPGSGIHWAWARQQRGGTLSTPWQTTADPESAGLDEPLIQHGIGDFQEAADVGTVHEIAWRSVRLGCLVARIVDGDHDFMQTIVNFLAGPVQPCTILGHFEA